MALNKCVYGATTTQQVSSSTLTRNMNSNSTNRNNRASSAFVGPRGCHWLLCCWPIAVRTPGSPCPGGDTPSVARKHCRTCYTQSVCVWGGWTNTWVLYSSPSAATATKFLLTICYLFAGSPSFPYAPSIYLVILYCTHSLFRKWTAPADNSSSHNHTGAQFN